MKLTPQDIELFKTLHTAGAGKALVDYLTRLTQDILDPDTLNKENLDGRKEAIRIIRESIIDRINMVNKVTKQTNEAE